MFTSFMNHSPVYEPYTSDQHDIGIVVYASSLGGRRSGTAKYPIPDADDLFIVKGNFLNLL